MAKVNTFICLITLEVGYQRMLETLYQHNEPDTFYVIVVDQTYRGLDGEMLRNTYPNLMYLRTPKTTTHPTGNLGFSMGNNIGISMVRTPYFTLVNDDVEFLDKRWWPAIMEEFERNPKAAALNPATPRLLEHDDKGERIELVPYKKEWTEEDYDNLLNSVFNLPHAVITKDTLYWGVMPWCCVFDAAKFREIGPLEEKFYPSGGEDHDWVARCAIAGYECFIIHKAWAWHWWHSSRSLDAMALEDYKRLLVKERVWNNLDEKWFGRFDIKPQPGSTLAPLSEIEL